MPREVTSPLVSPFGLTRVNVVAALACEESVSVLFRSKGRAKNGASKPLVSFLARPKPRISFLGLSLLRNSTETLATQAIAASKNVYREVKQPQRLR